MKSRLCRNSLSAILALATAIATPLLQAQESSILSTPAAPQNVAALIKNEVQIGSGAEAVYGSQIEVHYTGWLYNHRAGNLQGAKFDSSRDGGQPFAFHVGARQVIRGWDLGVIGMKVGGKRSLIIPSYLAYSTAGSGNIPPNTHLVFDIELLSVK